MKYSFVITILLSALPFLAQGFTIPKVDNTASLAGSDSAFDSAGFNSTLVPFADHDDEWEMVIFDKDDGKQCGGKADAKRGKGENTCVKIAKAVCATLEVGGKFGLGDKCEFTFKKDAKKDCDGDAVATKTIDKGKSPETYHIPKDVAFVTVHCPKK